MTQKEKLIEMLKTIYKEYSVSPSDDLIANYLINNGAVVLPCRCKNCVHRHWTQEPEHGKTVHYCDILDAQVDDNFFCGKGEKHD